jgi:hypothetical protein
MICKILHATSFGSQKISARSTTQMAKVLIEQTMTNNIATAFAHAESEIELIFLNAMNIASLVKDPTLLYFVPPSPSIEKDLEEVRRGLEELLQVWKLFINELPESSPREFFDFLGNLENVTEKDRHYFQSRFMMYFQGIIDTSFHVTLQPTFRSFRVNGKH